MATGRIGTTPVLTTRWSKAPSAGTTSLSGLDDNSVSLVYSVGYEAVYRNGTLLSRGNDYTATNGTSITLIDATLAGDIIEVFANQTIPLTDTYSQTVANSLFVNQATFDAKGDLIAGTADNAYSRLAVGSNNQVLLADSSTSTGLKWGAAPSPSYVGVRAITSSASIVYTTGADNAIPFAAEDFDSDGFHDNTTNNSRITIPTGKGGKYLITGQLEIGNAVTNYLQLRLYKNGSLLNAQLGRLFNWSAAGNPMIAGSTVLSLVAGDYIQLMATASDSFTSNTYASFTATFLGA